MKFLEGISVLTFIEGVLSGMAVQWFLISDFAACAKDLCVSLFVLSALLLFFSEFACKTICWRS